MTIETTLALPEELLRAVDERSSEFGSRSRLVEAALRVFLGRSRSRSERDAQDLAIIERHAEELNAEAEDALDFQIAL